MYLVNCRLLPELSGGVSAERGCVEIEDGLIAAVLPEAPEDAAEAFDCEGGTLLPGLIDLHTHITLLDGVALKCAADPMQVMVEAAAQAKRYLARGFTTIRDCGSVGRSANYVKRMIDAGIFQGPDILACGCILSPSVDGPEADFSSADNYCDGAEGFRLGVRREVAHRADFIKIYASGSAFSPAGVPLHPIMTAEEIRAAVETAEANGLRVAAHCHADSAIRECIRAGVRTIEHATYLGDETIDELLGTPGAYLVPTFAAMYVSQTEPEARAFWLARLTPMLESCAAGIEKAYRAGAKIGFGTDSGAMGKQYALGIEFRYRREYCHMENIDILLQATKHSAEIAGISNRAGEIRPGLNADLVLVDGRPDEDISVMYSGPKMVWKKGIKAV